MTSSNSTRTAVLTALAMAAFAANSVLARVALLTSTIDAASFSTIRLTGRCSHVASDRLGEGQWPPTGRGNLRARRFVEVCHHAVPLRSPVLLRVLGAKHRNRRTHPLRLRPDDDDRGSATLWRETDPLQWLGLLLALAGLVYLMLPGIAGQPIFSAALMALAGFSWGVYSLWGRGGANPLAQTTGNFTRAVPLVILLSLITLPDLHIEIEGALLAVASGALASGVGYVVWYAALGGLTATNAAIVQLSVPILAAAGGVAFLPEAVAFRLALSALMILGGIAFAVLERSSSIDEGGG